MIFRFLLLVSLALGAARAGADDLHALARMTGAEISQTGSGDLSVKIDLSQAVPFRIFHLAEPSRLVVDFNEADLSGIDQIQLPGSVTGLRAGTIGPGWSRAVMTVAEPHVLQSAEMATRPDQTATLSILFVPTTIEAFAASAGAPEEAEFPVLATAPPAPVSRQAGQPLKIVLDPGHGGIDPGAEAEGIVEADLMLQFARMLKDLLIRTGGFEVTLTRDDDIFVPLETRVAIAHEAGAHVFVSLHADTLSEGRASGAAVYTLSEAASDIASQRLAERHDRDQLLFGVDLSRQDDEVALVLMDLARTNTAHRSGRLADAIVAGLEAQVELYKRPRLEAGFSVLKSAEIPSILIELGFMSSTHDLTNLADPDWRGRAAEGIRDGLVDWAMSDLAEADLRRQ